MSVNQQNFMINIPKNIKLVVTVNLQNISFKKIINNNLNCLGIEINQINLKLIHLIGKSNL